MISLHENILITGAAGFIGFHLAKKLLKLGAHVVGLDNMSSYYDPGLKKSRLDILSTDPNFEFYQLDLIEKDKLVQLFARYTFGPIVHLAAQAGVRYSAINPYQYLQSNYHGFLNILEACRVHPPAHLIYASSSSVYGANRSIPFSVHDNVDHPISLYAASKKANELMAHTYSASYKIPTTGLRFFTVYGPYGRPDMAIFQFTKAILDGHPINVYNYGKMKRDFTYVDDVVESIVRLLPRIPQSNSKWNGNHPDPATSFAPYRIFNVGNHEPRELMKLISILEEKLGVKAIKNLLPLQDGDIPETYADVEDLIKEIDFKPSTSLEDGIEKFVEWYRGYYAVKGKSQREDWVSVG